ncbi:putative chromo domain-containing protein LHP1 [Hordeum vulgare]|nr:putative chromo domain-containing protein LHP1 [Hordeum vulgare]
MGRGKKDSTAAGGSVDPVVGEEAMAVMEVEEEEVQGDEEEEWNHDEDEAEDEEEEWEQEEEEEPDEASAEEQPEEQRSPPKLAEGYYEIETIRRRRRRQGQLQYLVKWRGWPESANTWEPAENLRACSDFVDAFEKRQQPRSYGKRKRKRKISITPVVTPNPSSHGRRGRPRRSDPRSLSQRPAPERKILPPRASSRRGTDNSNRHLVTGSAASVNVAGQQMLGQGATQEGSSNVLSVGLPSVVVHQQDEHQPASGVSKAGISVQGPQPQVGQVTGAKKRKLGSIRRFKQDEAHQEQGQVLNGTSEKPGNEDADSTQGETGDRTKGQDGANQRITKIIKPVRYFATMVDDVQQVSITFRALRSDGQEVLVDDKELKSTNPLVLINYYEQHLRYSPTS